MKPVHNNDVYVFGSNLEGIHGRGQALEAHDRWGAKYGIGEGPTGRAYALPTKKTPYIRLSLKEIGSHVEKFLHYAGQHPEQRFLVQRIGTGSAGYTDYEIAPFFIEAPNNVILPEGWNKLILMSTLDRETLKEYVRLAEDKSNMYTRSASSVGQDRQYLDAAKYYLAYYAPLEV